MFVGGYLLVWTAFSAIAASGQLVLHRADVLSEEMVLRSSAVSGVLLLLAGLYQWLPFQNRCLTRCQAPLAFLTQHWRPGVSGGLMMGLRHGAYCVGCCWLLMALLFVVVFIAGWGVIGSAMQCYDTALQYTLFRKQFGDKPLAGHQIVQERLVEMITEISKAQLLALQVGRLKDQGRATHPQISMLKRNNCAIALDVARRARDLLGANGIADEYPVFRHMANLESVNTYEGTHDIHTLAIGESITGIAAYG